MNRLVPWSDVVPALSSAALLDGMAVARSPQPLPTGLRTPAVADSGCAISLSGATSPTPPLREVLASRRSHRMFDEMPVPLAPVAAAVLASWRADAAWSSDQCSAGLRLDFYVLANRIEGVDRGVYQLDPAAGVLRRTAAELPNLEDLVIQLELADTPALVIVAGSLLAAQARDGVHGYRLLMARASCSLYTGWLAAIGSGAVGCLFAGLLSPMRLLVCTDGFDRAPLCALSLGAARRT